MKKNVFVIIFISILLLFTFIETTKAQVTIPPIGCSCSTSCVGGPSYWVSPTQYQGYYACYPPLGFACPSAPAGWREISSTTEDNDSHGCDFCGGLGGCAVTGILWEKIPAPTCTILASPDSFLEGESPDITITWTTTSAASATLNGTLVPAASLAAGNKIFTAVFSAASYIMSVTGLDGSTISCAANVSVIAPVNVILNIESAIVETDIAAILTNILKWLLKVSGSIALLMLIFAGTMYITSSGDSEKTEKAKKFISTIIIGLILILLSYAILIVINNIFT